MVTDSNGILIRKIIARIHLLLSVGNADVAIHRDKVLLQLYGKVYREFEQTGRAVGHAFRLQDGVPEWHQADQFLWYVETYCYLNLNDHRGYKQLSQEQKAAFRIIFAAFLVSTREEEQSGQVYGFGMMLTTSLAVVSIFDPAVDEVCSGLLDYQLVVSLLASRLTELSDLKRQDFVVAYEVLLAILASRAAV